MKPFEIILIVVCVLFVIGVIVARVIAKKKGKSSCDCGCSDCAACKYCAEARKSREEK